MCPGSSLVIVVGNIASNRDGPSHWSAKFRNLCFLVIYHSCSVSMSLKCGCGCARVRMCDHCPILVGTSVQTHTQYFLMIYHLLRVAGGANHGMSSKRLWLAATTGLSTMVSQRTDTMPACTVLVYSNIAAYCSHCNVIVMMGTR